MREPVWLSESLVLAIHERQLAEHGGSTGVRDTGMLESALARPQHKFTYGGDDIDMSALAAAYAFGIARNHPFVDGNKRTAAVACETFLNLNGYTLTATDTDLYPVFLALAGGEMEEESVGEWLRDYVRPNQVNEPGAHYETTG